MQMQKIIRQESPLTKVYCELFDKVSNSQSQIYWKREGMEYIIFLYLFVCLFGAVANLLVIASFIKTPHLHNLRNYFVVNLAFSDLMLCCTFKIIIQIYDLSSGLTAPATVYFTVNLFWPFGDLSCKMLASLQGINMFVSSLTLVLIALDRALLILCPVRWKFQLKAPLLCYVVVWLTAFLVAAPYFFVVSAEDARLHPWSAKYTERILKICRKRKPQICLERTWHRLPFSRRTYTLTVLAIQYILPLLALGFAYSHIVSTIRRRVKRRTSVDQQRKQNMIQQNRRAVLLLLLLVLIYGMSWLPINAYNVLTVFDVIEFNQSKYIICHLIGMTSACLNPIMYGLINEAFRNAFFAMLRSIFHPCTKFILVSPQLPTNTTFNHRCNRKVIFTKGLVFVNRLIVEVFATRKKIYLHHPN